MLIRCLELAMGERCLLMEIQLYISGIADSAEVQWAFFEWFESNWSLYVQYKTGIFVRSGGLFINIFIALLFKDKGRCF